MLRFLPRSRLLNNYRIQHTKISAPFSRGQKYSTSTMTETQSFTTQTGVDATTTATVSPAAAETAKLPKLSASDFRIYNRMAEHMDYFHNHFRQTWNVLYNTASTGKRPSGMSIRQFLSMGEQFCRQLTMHHTIEEQHIFPILAKKMDAFREELELLTHHKKIHAGLEVLEKYLEDCKLGETELRMSELKSIMDGFGTVLWEHLDAEVKQLGAENMRKYWTVKEMQRMPM